MMCFDYPTINLLATRIVQKEAPEDLLPPVTAEQPRPEYIPLSFSQERLWFYRSVRRKHPVPSTGSIAVKR